MSKLGVLSVLFSVGLLGCDDGGRIVVVPTYPADEPNLITDADVAQLLVELYAADGDDAAPQRSVTLTQGEKLNLDKIGNGPWFLKVRGLDGAGKEAVSGSSKRFAIAAGETREIPIFIARSHAFNLVALAPADLDARLSALMGHTATPFTDENGEEWILVAGGFVSGENASDEAYLVDPGSLTITKLDAKMSRARSGHSALAIAPPGRAPVVVLADGDSPVTQLEVYDTARRSFFTVDVSCGPSAFSGMTAALTRSADDELVPSGRAILTGAELCVVDPYGRLDDETWPTPTGVEPTAPASTASNAAGQILVVDAAGSLWSTSAIERSSQEAVCEGTAGMVWPGSIGARQWATLSAIGDADRFALIGGVSSTGATPSSDWALIGTAGCEVVSVVEGSSGSKTPVRTPLVLDLSESNESSPALDLIVTGGTNQRRGDSNALVGGDDVFAGLDATTHPIWYAEHGAWTPSLREARSGHAIAVAANGNMWIIGGGASHSEVFEVGAEASEIAPASTALNLRRPVLTAMTVLDASNEGRDLVPLIQQDQFLNKLFDAEKMTTTVFLVGGADRGGIGDDLDIGSVVMADNEYCQANPVTAPSSIDYGTVSGDADGIVLPEAVTSTTNDPQQAIDNAQSAITNAMNNATQKALSQTADSLGSNQAMRALAPGHVVDEPDVAVCGWRQYLRTGFDGIGYEGTEKDATYPGVNVLMLMVTSDDCSQGWYLPSGGDLFGETAPDSLPAELTEMSCDDAAMDEYLNVPLSAEERAEFGSVVRELVWNPQDLVVAVVGQGTPGTALPRRLSYLTGLLEDAGAQLVDMRVEDTGDTTAFDLRISALSERIESRNPYQVCVPPDVVDGLAAPFQSDILVDGLFLPVDRGTPWSSDILDGIEDKVRARCRLLRQSATGDGANHATLSEVVDWRVSTDSDLRAGCSTDESTRSGWTVQVDAAAVTENDALFLQCSAE